MFPDYASSMYEPSLDISSFPSLSLPSRASSPSDSKKALGGSYYPFHDNINLQLKLGGTFVGAQRSLQDKPQNYHFATHPQEVDCVSKAYETIRVVSPAGEFYNSLLNEEPHSHADEYLFSQYLQQFQKDDHSGSEPTDIYIDSAGLCCFSDSSNPVNELDMSDLIGSSPADFTSVIQSMYEGTIEEVMISALHSASTKYSEPSSGYTDSVSSTNSDSIFSSDPVSLDPVYFSDSAYSSGPSTRDYSRNISPMQSPKTPFLRPIHSKEAPFQRSVDEGSTPLEKSPVQLSRRLRRKRTYVSPIASLERSDLDIDTAIELAVKAMSKGGPNLKHEEAGTSLKFFDRITKKDKIYEAYTKAEIEAVKMSESERNCNHCASTFPDYNQLIDHYETANLFLTRPRVYVCPLPSCPMHLIGYDKKADMRHHVVSSHFHRGYVASGNLMHAQKLIEVVFTCSHNGCGKGFYRKDSLTRHNHLVHINTTSTFNMRRRRKGKSI